MECLTRNGKALRGENGVIAVKPYADMWGYQQSKLAEQIGLYDWIYQCLYEGFSVASRTVDGVTYTIDGGNSGISHATGYDPDQELHWLVIPLAQFDIPADTDTATSVEAFSAVFRVISDNPELLATLSPSFYSVTKANGKVSTFLMHFPYNMTALRQKRREIKLIVPTIDSYVTTQTTYSMASKPTTTAGKAAVAGALHDWLVANVDNNTGSEPYYWTHNAYNCLQQATPRYTDCNGFAVAYAYLCNLYGINCIPTYGGVGDVEGGATSEPEGRQNHEWNMLSLTLPIGTYSADPSAWYAVDVRMDEYVDDTFRTEQSSVYWKEDGDRVTTDTPGWSRRRFFLSDKVYGESGFVRLHKGRSDHDYTLRANNAIGYPVDVPAGVWTEPAGNGK